MSHSLLPPMTEKEFQNQVLGYAGLRGWLIVHFRPALTRSGRWATAVQAQGTGYPDLTLCREDRLIFAELKTDRGRLTLLQQKWLEALRKTSAEVYLWRPNQWVEIERILN